MDSAETQTLGYGWAALLGALQGFTEFLPVSSSGHLALAEHLGRGHAENVAFDLLLHLATLLVVAVAFGRDAWDYWRHRRVVLWYLAVATLPAVLIGMAFRHELEALRENPVAVCAALLVTAAALFAADRAEAPEVELERLGWHNSLLVGLCQALAIVPGISRSGSTIGGGLLCGLKREEAVKFSFLMMVPVVAGAALLKFVDEPGCFATLPAGPAALGFVAALAGGFGALKFLLRVVRWKKLTYFAVYCAAVALAGLLYFGLLGGDRAGGEKPAAVAER